MAIARQNYTCNMQEMKKKSIAKGERRQGEGRRGGGGGGVGGGRRRGKGVEGDFEEEGEKKGVREIEGEK